MKESSTFSYFNRIIFMFLFFGMMTQHASAQYQIEKLDRGVVAVSMGGTKVFISWRWLGTEDDITFNLYRNGVKVNTTPLTVANYTDNAGSTTASYTVTTIVNGVEQTASSGVKPWAQQYLKIPISAPPAGKTPTGEAYSYEANDASIADLDGDGQWEIILKWNPTNAKDNSQSGYTGNTYIDAYKFDGTRMWRIDFGRNIRSGAHYLDFMVYDFDGDGQAEMMARTADATIDGTGIVIGNANADYRSTAGYVLTGPEFITVFNGKTGKAMATNNLYPPRGVVGDWGDTYGNRVDRFKACVAYLDGKRPSGVFIRGYYAKWGAEAIDWRDGKLTQRWTYMCPNDKKNPCYEEGAHSVSVADVDGDGKQEIITGSLILDDNGTMYYNTMIGHGDALHVSDMDPDLPGLEISHIQEPVGNAGLYMYSGKTKNVLWRKATLAGSSEGPGRGVCADISAKYRGAESWCSGGGIPGVFDCKGNLTTLATPQSCNFLAWWDGDLLRELLNNTMIDKFDAGRLLTAYNIAPIASNNGTKSTPCLSGDIMGDWREEVIWRGAANDALYIFTTTTPSTYKFRTLMHDAQYRVAIAWQNTGYNHPPHLSYYLGDGMATPEKPNIVVIPPANLVSSCSSTITSPSNVICGSGSIVLTANAGSSYKWFNGTNQVGTASTYSVNAAGSYTVEVTNAAGCKSTSAAKVITVNTLPIIIPYVQVDGGTWTNTSTASVCEGSALNFGPQPTTLGNWSWTGPNNFTSTLREPTLASIVAANAGNYITTYTDANGCKATNSFALQVTKATATITTPSTSFCTGGSLILNASTGASYKWFYGTTQAGTASTLTITNAGSYTVEVTNASGCKAVSTTTQITENALPIITNNVKIDNGAWTATSSATACESSTVNLGPQPNLTAGWNWTGPNNFKSTLRDPILTSILAANAGTYTATYTDLNGCKATSNVALLVSKATATITAPSTSICAGNTVVLTASTGASYKWFKGTTQAGTASTLTVTDAGTYTVEVTNASGCKAISAATQISVNTATTPTITAPSTSICGGNTVVLTASTGNSYKWFKGTTQAGTASTLTVTDAGTYTVEVTNASGCKAISAATQIGVNTAANPTITAPSTSICAGNTVLLTASAGTSYKWFKGTTPAGTTSTLTVTDAGAYTVEVTNASGCKAVSAATQISVNTAVTPTITAPSTSICGGNTVVLTASTGNSYKWFKGTTLAGTASTLTVTDAGTYTVEVTNASGCKAVSAPTQISVNTATTPTITTPSTSICTGNTVLLTASTGTSYKWFKGTTPAGTTSTLTVTDAGTYTVEVTNASDCKAVSDPTQISVTNTITWYADVDNDGKGNANTILLSCTQPQGYVSTSGDACTTDANKTEPGNCGCDKTEISCLDCAGVANGTAVLDNCNICVAGNTGKTACLSTATINGTNANITVVPQPFDLNTSISIDNLGMIQSYTIISSNGALIETKSELNTEEIILGDQLASGLYTVIIRTEKGMYTTKIVKK